MIKTLINQKQSQIILKFSFWVIFFLLLYLTLTPTPPKPISFNNIDKFYHFSAFAGLTFFFTIAYKELKGMLIILLPITLGVLIEFIQYYIPNRGFSIADMLADAVGVLIGYWVAKNWFDF